MANIQFDQDIVDFVSTTAEYLENEDLHHIFNGHSASNDDVHSNFFRTFNLIHSMSLAFDSFAKHQ